MLLHLMAPPPQEPSEAARLEAVAEAGMGADDSKHAARHADDGSSTSAKSFSPTSSLEAAAEESKKEVKPEEPQRSKLKTALIMLSLCVRLLRLTVSF